MDDEVKGEGNSYTTFFRQLDPRLGRWLSLDPVFQPHQSPYNSMDNNPIWYNDPMGDDVGYETKRDKIKVDFLKLISRRFREAHAKREASSDMYIYRHRKDEPPLIAPSVNFDFEVPVIIDAGKEMRIGSQNNYSVRYDGLGIDIKLPHIHIPILSEIIRISFGVIKLPVGLFSGAIIGFWNLFTFKNKDLHVGWGMNIRVSTQNDIALFGYGFGNYNKYNMFGFKRGNWAHSADKIDPNDGHDGLFGIRFGMGKHRPIQFLDFGQQIFTRKAKEIHFHINIVGKSNRRTKLDGEDVFDFVN